MPQPGGGFEWTREPWGRALRCRALLEVADHVFTTKNLLLREDAADWGVVAGALGVLPARVLLIRQVHRADVAVARGGRLGEWTRPEADVIVSDDSLAAVGVRVADCAPILLADRRLGVVGAAHAGWRGTVQRAADAAVTAMAREFGSSPADLVAAIGPCLGPCCGEVGEEVVAAFLDAGHTRADVARWFTSGPTPKPYLDLATANADQLRAAGVRDRAVHVSSLCTKTHAGLLHSYRAAGPHAGRMVGAIRARGH